MIETHARKHVQPLLDNFGSWLIPYKITANSITLIAFIVGLSSGYCISLNYLKIALILLLISGLLDMLDGTIARLTNTQHNFGAYCDLISDRMVEASVILGFAILYPQHMFAYLLFFVAVLLHFSTFVAAGALFPNMSKKSMHYDKSIVERAEAFVVFFVMLLFPQYIFELLMTLNVIIFAAGIMRFKRVMEYVESV